MQQITVSKEAYDRMVIALSMVAMAIESNEEVSKDALREVLTVAGFPEV
jgi:hypothetical protein